MELKTNELDSIQIELISSIESKIKESENVESQKIEAQKIGTEKANSIKKSADLREKVRRYREEYPGGEDPNFTWDDAVKIIEKIKGKEDETFFYNGKRDVSMDDKGRRNYPVWTQNPNASSNAEGTMEYFTVYEDGTIEGY